MQGSIQTTCFFSVCYDGQCVRLGYYKVIHACPDIAEKHDSTLVASQSELAVFYDTCDVTGRELLRIDENVNNNNGIMEAIYIHLSLCNVYSRRRPYIFNMADFLSRSCEAC